jgi:DNA-binding MarR family transcriptional regulator
MTQGSQSSAGQDEDLEAFFTAIRLTRPLLRHITATVDEGARIHGVTVGQRAVLEALFEAGALSGPQLVSVLALKRQFVFRMLGETDSAGLTLRRPNPKRARAYIHLLTDEGTPGAFGHSKRRTRHIA